MEKELDKNITIEQLISKCERGSVVHQEMLYKKYYGYALTVCRLYTYSNDEAVSILNDSFLKVFTSIEKKRYNRTIPFKNWLRRILINTAIDHYRKNIKHLNHLDIEESNEIFADINVIDNLTAEDILSLLDQLPEIQRIVFNLYEIQGFKHNEISEKLLISESSSRVFLTRAKKKLRVLIGKNF